MRIDWKALVYAVICVALSAALAAFGGPHGALGAIPWVVTLPGILFVIAIPSERYVEIRLAAAVLTQVLVWYLVLAAWRRSRMRTTGQGRSAA